MEELLEEVNLEIESGKNLAVVRRIDAIIPIDGADRIEIVKVDSWQCVSQKSNGFQPGDLCVYFELDAILPKENPEFEFLEGKPLRSRKFKGEISQGLVLPLSILNTGDYYLGTNKEAEPEYIGYRGDDEGLRKKHHVSNFDCWLVDGLDVTDILGVQKYIKSIPACLSGKVKGNFPSHIVPKTDESRLQGMSRIIDIYQGTTFVACEKLNGSSCTVIVKDGFFRLCSRNLELEEDESNSFWQTVNKYDLRTKLLSLNRNIACQGELIGNGVQKNPYGLKDLELYFFNVYDIDKHQYIDTGEARDLLVELDLQWVPVLGEYTFDPDTSVSELLTMADGFSQLNPNTMREGLVFRPLQEQWHEKYGRLSFKVVSNKFLLKYGE